MTYDALIASEPWQQDLAGLNSALTEALDRFNAPRLLNGNLFYDHLQPQFWEAPLLADCNMKRRRLFQAAKDARVMFEIGVNGGHSLFLALSANPQLRAVGVDICRQIAPTWGRVDIYVPAGVAWLRTRFQTELPLIQGDSRTVVPQFAYDNPDVEIDLLHLDGDKQNYLRDFINIQPLLAEGAVIIVDDTNMGGVRRTARQIVQLGFAEPHPDFEDFDTEKYQNIVLRAKKRGSRL